MKSRKTPPGLERRDISGQKPAVTDEGKIRGLAIPFNSWTTIGVAPWSFRERIAPGAVTKTLRESDVVYLDNHDPAKPISRVSAGTLEITPSPHGAFYEADPADTSYARDLVVNIRAKNILGNSFGFEVVKEKWEIGADGVEERTLLEIKLPEISACTFPAYGDTEIGMRDAYDAAMEARERHWHMLLRAKYDEAQIEAMGKKGQAFKNPDGHYSYPIGDREDLENAIHAVGRGGASHDAIRAYIIRRAKALGLPNLVPDGWSADGSSKSGENAAPAAAEQRDDPDGVEVTAMQTALAHLKAGDTDAASQALKQGLANTDSDDDDAYGNEDSSGMVAHTNPGGAAVNVPRTEDGNYDLREVVKAFAPDISQAYDLVRSEFPATEVTNQVLSLLHPFVSETTAEGREAPPKPESSTSEIKAGSDAGIAMDLRWKSTLSKFRL